MLYEPMLESGTFLNDSLKIIDLIGSGGQGEVYKVQYNNHFYALKWYFSYIWNDDLKKSLLNLISKGSQNDYFLWPISLVEYNGQFGYLMELRPLEYKSLLDWVTLKFDMSFTSIAKAGFQLTDAFHKLHAKGFSYKDISFGNLFINPENGNILICDNDNITANGVNVNGLLGTPKFMAPEIVMGGTSPNTETDQFSLAILLFYMMCISHPFEGALEAHIHCLDEEASIKLFGTDAVFIYDENNDSNRPIPGIHNNPINLWKHYPQYIRDLFHKTFTFGVKNPSKRTRESEWRQAFFKMYNSIIKCPHCGMENFYNHDVLVANGKLEPCILCHKDYPLPPRMRILNRIIVLDDEKQLSVNHINQSDPANFTIIANIKKINSDFLFKNVSQDTWSYVRETETIDLLPQQTLVLKDNIIINFLNVKGEIKL